MRNISQFPKLAAAAIKEVDSALKLKPDADYADWLFAMMRKGFTKDESLVEFRKLGLTLLPDGKIDFPKPTPFEVLKKIEASRKGELNRQADDFAKRSEELRRNMEEVKAKIAKRQAADLAIRSKLVLAELEEAREQTKEELRRAAETARTVHQLREDASVRQKGLEERVRLLRQRILDK